MSNEVRQKDLSILKNVFNFFNILSVPSSKQSILLIYEEHNLFLVRELYTTESSRYTHDTTTLADNLRITPFKAYSSLKFIDNTISSSHYGITILTNSLSLKESLVSKFRDLPHYIEVIDSSKLLSFIYPNIIPLKKRPFYSKKLYKINDEVALYSKLLHLYYSERKISNHQFKIILKSIQNSYISAVSINILTPILHLLFSKTTYSSGRYFKQLFKLYGNSLQNQIPQNTYYLLHNTTLPPASYNFKLKSYSSYILKSSPTNSLLVTTPTHTLFGSETNVNALLETKLYGDKKELVKTKESQSYLIEDYSRKVELVTYNYIDGFEAMVNPEVNDSEFISDNKVLTKISFCNFIASLVSNTNQKPLATLINNIELSKFYNLNIKLADFKNTTIQYSTNSIQYILNHYNTPVTEELNNIINKLTIQEKEELKSNIKIIYSLYDSVINFIASYKPNNSPEIFYRIKRLLNLIPLLINKCIYSTVKPNNWLEQYNTFQTYFDTHKTLFSSNSEVNQSTLDANITLYKL